MRILLFISYYCIALLVGFAIRGKFDSWMYAKPHMQGRLRIFSHEILAATDEEGRNSPDVVFLPPPTLDALAFNAAAANRQVSEREEEIYEQLRQDNAAAEAAGGEEGEPEDAGYYDEQQPAQPQA